MNSSLRNKGVGRSSVCTTTSATGAVARVALASVGWLGLLGFLGFLGFLAACTAAVDENGTDPSYDPFGALAAKTDGAEDFFSRDRTWQVTISADPDDAEDFTVAITGPDLTANYDRASLRDWAVTGESTTRRVRLRRRHRMAGMRSFLLRPLGPAEDVTALLDQQLLYAAVGVAAPRVVRTRVSLDGDDLGEHLLIEHVGDRFLDRHFDTSGGDVARTMDSDWAPLFAQRLAADDVTPWHLSSFLDVDTMAAVLAVQAVTGAAGDDTGLSFYDPCKGTPRPCLVPIPEVNGNVVDITSLREALLGQTPARHSWADALTKLIHCFGESECGDNSATADRAQTLWAREFGADAPSGRTDYPPFRRINDNVFEVAFRNMGHLHAQSVTARFFSDPAAEAVELPLAYDRSRDLWTAAIEARSPFTYDFVIVDPDGVSEVRVDPATTTVAARSHQDPATIDGLTEVARVRLDVAEPSGLTTFGSRLFVIGDEGDDIFEIDPVTGRQLARIDLNVRGLEGVAIDPVLGDLYVADEDRGVLLRFSPEGDPRGSLHFGWTEDSGGIEGLTFRASDGHLFFAKERSPARIAEVTPAEELLRRPRVTWARDVSALAHSTDDGQLYALSDEDQRLYRLDDNFDVVTSWPLAVDKPEGLAIHQGLLYVVSDSTGELVTYTLNRSRWAP